MAFFEAVYNFLNKSKDIYLFLEVIQYGYPFKTVDLNNSWLATPPGFATACQYVTRFLMLPKQVSFVETIKRTQASI